MSPQFSNEMKNDLVEHFDRCYARRMRAIFGTDPCWPDELSRARHLDWLAEMADDAMEFFCDSAGVPA